VKSLLGLLEPEEFVGKLGHRLTSATVDEARRSLGIVFRGLGGAPGLSIVPVGAGASGHRQQSRDLAVALLVDASRSTDSWVGPGRVIDIARESALIFSHALDAGGDPHAVFAFTSKGRNDVRVEIVKDFSEAFSPAITKRLRALRPGHYTRIGAALRHTTAQLDRQPAHDRLLLVRTDGKPNDADHYEGRFGIEDTRRAIQEARRDGVRVFGITIDVRAQALFPILFGRGGFAIVSDPARLPAAMPLLLKHLMAG